MSRSLATTAPPNSFSSRKLTSPNRLGPHGELIESDWAVDRLNMTGPMRHTILPQSTLAPIWQKAITRLAGVELIHALLKHALTCWDI
jgi:hypothetical protein